MTRLRLLVLMVGLVVLAGCANNVESRIETRLAEFERRQDTRMNGKINTINTGIGWRELLAGSVGAAAVVYALGHSWTSRKRNKKESAGYGPRSAAERKMAGTAHPTAES